MSEEQFSLQEVPANQKAIILFRGVPEVYRIVIGSTRSAIDIAEREALRLIEDEGQEAVTYMAIPLDSLTHSLVMRNEGIKIHALTKILAEEDSDG